MQHWNFFRVQELIGIGEDIQFQHDNDAGRIILAYPVVTHTY